MLVSLLVILSFLLASYLCIRLPGHPTLAVDLFLIKQLQEAETWPILADFLRSVPGMSWDHSWFCTDRVPLHFLLTAITAPRPCHWNKSSVAALEDNSVSIMDRMMDHCLPSHDLKWNLQPSTTLPFWYRKALGKDITFREHSKKSNGSGYIGSGRTSKSKLAFCSNTALVPCYLVPEVCRQL